MCEGKMEEFPHSNNGILILTRQPFRGIDKSANRESARPVVTIAVSHWSGRIKVPREIAVRWPLEKLVATCGISSFRTEELGMTRRENVIAGGNHQQYYCTVPTILGYLQ